MTEPARRAPDGLRPAVLGAVALGGAVGGLARWGVAHVVPGTWATVVVDVAGCLLVGALTAWLGHRPRGPLAGPFLAVGLLGGFTTFSTWATDVVTLVDGGATAAGLAHAVGLPVAAVVAALVGLTATRRALARRSPAHAAGDGDAA